jgi:hypothetical protein
MVVVSFSRQCDDAWVHGADRDAAIRNDGLKYPNKGLTW